MASVELDDETSAAVAAFAERLKITPDEVLVLALRRLAEDAVPEGDWSRIDEATMHALADRLGLTPRAVVILALRRLAGRD